MRVLCYLYQTRHLSLIYNFENKNNEILDSFVDTDWAGDHTDRKSTSGYLIRLYNNLIH